MRSVDPGWAVWFEAAGRGEVSRRLERVQRGVDARAAGRAVCRNSGRCCRFDDYGHRLYVSGLEAAWFVRRAAEMGDGAAGGARPGRVPLPQWGQAIEADPGGCPFQRDRMCTAHAVRPFGCRVFFCDAEGEAWMERLYEDAHELVRRLHERAGLPYRFGDWRGLLAEASSFFAGHGSPAYLPPR
ncbi:MAG: hypothetical protein AAF612_03050 [Planctomycetota bacterium]